MADIRFDGQVAIVTGAGRGMGRSHALLLAERGAKVVVNDLGLMADGSDQGEDPASQVVREIVEAGGTAIADRNDVSSEAGVAAIVQGAIDAYGRVDILVHNAGVVSFTPFGEMDYATFRRIVSVHADGGFLLAKAVWPHMVAQKHGRMVFVTSQAALYGVPAMAHYALAKTGLTGLSRTIALEGAEHGIKSNSLSVCAYTRLMESLFKPLDDGRADSAGGAAQEQWWMEYMRPELTSPAVAWLASTDCPVSGEIIDTGGGLVANQRLMMSHGYCKADLTPEDVRDNLAAIMSEEPGRQYFTSVGEYSGWQIARAVEGGAPPLPTD